jgi:hypothetical protein
MHMAQMNCHLKCHKVYCVIQLTVLFFFLLDIQNKIWIIKNSYICLDTRSHIHSFLYVPLQLFINHINYLFVTSPFKFTDVTTQDVTFLTHKIHHYSVHTALYMFHHTPRFCSLMTVLRETVQVYKCHCQALGCIIIVKLVQIYRATFTYKVMLLYTLLITTATLCLYPFIFIFRSFNSTYMCWSFKTYLYMWVSQTRGRKMFFKLFCYSTLSHRPVHFTMLSLSINSCAILS